MDSNEKIPPVDPPPYTKQPGSQPQPGYTAHPGYTAKPGSSVQPGYTAQPGQQSQPGYTAQFGNPPTQPLANLPHPYPASPATLPLLIYHSVAQHFQQSTTVVSVSMPASKTVTLPANPRPQNYRGVSIFTCLCCVLPFGLAAIVFSCMVDRSYEAGDYAGALRNSYIAKWLNVASFLCGIVLIVILITIPRYDIVTNQ